MNLKERITVLKQPEKIKEALYASSPTVLGFVFEEDPSVREVIAAGAKSIPLIAREIEQNGTNLHDITLSCYAHILTKVNLEAASQVFRPLYKKIAQRPGSFAAMFSTRALRMEKNIPVDAKELYFTPEQIQETLKSLEQ